MADVSQGTAEQLALQAQRESKSGEHHRAIETQRKAVSVRERELDDLVRDGSALADERREAAHRLSDYLGRLGGMYRQADMIPDGIEAYQRGMELERQYQLDDSYNVTNWIVLQLLDSPGRLAGLGSAISQGIAVRPEPGQRPPTGPMVGLGRPRAAPASRPAASRGPRRLRPVPAHRGPAA